MKPTERLISKYNRPGPRYTSYPPVPFWKDPPDETMWFDHIKKSYDEHKGIDLYVHIPFCEKLCYYCGCNRTITKNHQVEVPFIESLLQEWEIYKKGLGFIPKINSLHFGGGTPTFLSSGNLKTLITNLTFKRTQDFIGSIEIDPRTCREDDLLVMAESGIQRVSLGIQDFDPVVQSAINRHQPVAMVEQLMEKLRGYGFKSINFDLIYGLPKQTLESVSSTMKIVSQLCPDLIAFYGYAHLPSRIKNQRLINDTDLPSAQERRELYDQGKMILTQHDYEEVGMDHFARPGSFLHQAKKNNQLHRNFMGYVDKKSSVLIGLGPTSISDSSLSFVQNEKEISLYEQKIKSGLLPISHGHTHNAKDLAVQKMVLDLMCGGEAKICAEVPYQQEVLLEMKGFAEDGLLVVESNRIRLYPQGIPFMRNVAMSFDYHLREQENKVRFSQTV